VKRKLMDEHPDESWKPLSACLTADPALFYPTKTGRSSANSDVADAKAICRRCPVREECLEYALRHREKFGIWGGMSERERRSYQKDWNRRHDASVAA
jgi:WhiB family redox-sensing transcriptional regulator